MNYLAKNPGPGEVTSRAPAITNPALVGKLKEILESDYPGVTFFNLMLNNIIVLIFIIAVLAFFFMFIIGGIQWITSGGDKAATESARGRITAALIGLIIVFAVYAILALIKTFFGFDVTEIDISRLFLE